jgi:hypothetical protein
MARDLMILMRANPLQGPMECPENLDFLGPEIATSEALPFQGSNKISIFRAHPFQWPL